MNNLRYYSISNINVTAFLISHFLRQVRLLSVTSVTSVTSLRIWPNSQEILFFFPSLQVSGSLKGETLPCSICEMYCTNSLYYLQGFCIVVFLLLKAVRITLNHATHSPEGTLIVQHLHSTGICLVVVTTLCTVFLYNEIFLSSLWLKSFT